MVTSQLPDTEVLGTLVSEGLGFVWTLVSGPAAYVLFLMNYSEV